MRKSLMSAIAVGALVLGACGDDDGGSGSSGVQGEAAEQAIAAGEEAGFDLDADCVNELAGQLSDDDAQAIVDAGPDGDAELSPEGEALSEELLSCVDQDALVDAFITEIVNSGQNVDEECLRSALEGTDLGSIDPDNPPTELVTAVVECTDL